MRYARNMKSKKMYIKMGTSIDIPEQEDISEELITQCKCGRIYDRRYFDPTKECYICKNNQVSTVS